MRKIDDPVTVVDSDGVLITAVGAGSEKDVTLQSENKEALERVRRAANLRTDVEIVHLAKNFTAGWETPMEVAAAVYAAAPGRTILLEAPDEVVEAIKKVAGPNTPGVIY